MKLLLGVLPILALAASCSQAEEGSPQGSEKRLCTAAEAGAATAARATELLNTVKESDSKTRDAACARFAEVIEDGRKANIAALPGCRWDNRNSNGNPHFLISLHLTQLKGQARATCGNLD
ncbi:hypothetical protein [Allosphingosinicella deserti]|uniref:Lipoprotein n=1 Tax=Allosphingosinicella deserti TaxID=2116704 RepID=A0A2P7QZU7_9SPHN|nr:hypothetical protein [Sphingomonas deserti]PSJ43479.1 hypothetical protein C7I55_03755 [Sphingomonas deserti]